MTRHIFIITAFVMIAGAVAAQIPKAEFVKNYDAQITSIEVDLSGNIYSTGIYSNSAQFGELPNTVFNFSSEGNLDFFVFKSDPNGVVLWAKSYGFVGDDVTRKIKVDAAGHVYIVGSFAEEVNFDPGGSEFSLVSYGERDAFYLKLDPDGNFISAGSWGGPFNDEALSIDFFSSSLDVFITGYYTDQADLDPTSGNFDVNEDEDEDSFVIKLGTSGNFLWASAVGETGYDAGVDISVDTFGDPIIVGRYTESLDIDPSAADQLFLPAISPSSNRFLTKLNGTDGTLQWGQSISADEDNTYSAIATDAQGNIYLAGNFVGTGDFDPDISEMKILTSINSRNDIFVAKYHPSGNLLWAYAFGSDQSDEGTAINASLTGDIVVTGNFANAIDFDPDDTGEFFVESTSEEYQDVFVLKLKTDGSFVFAGGFGTDAGGVDDKGYSILSDDSGNIFVAGYVNDEADMDPSNCVLFLDPETGQYFILKIGTQPDDCSGITITQQPASVAVCPGEIANLKVVVSGGPVTYQWFETDGLGTSLGDITDGGIFTGAQTETLRVNTSGFIGFRNFRVRIEDGIDIATSETATIEAKSCIPPPPLAWAKSFLASSYTLDIETDADGNVYTTGYFIGTQDFDPNSGVFNMTSAGGNEGFVAKWNKAGDFVWARALAAGTLDSQGNALRIDKDGNVIVVGNFRGTIDLDPGAATVTAVTNGGLDGYTTTLDRNGNYLWGFHIGSTGEDQFTDVAISVTDDILLGGYFSGATDFDPSASNFFASSTSASDGFLLKLTSTGAFASVLRFEGVGATLVTSLAVHSSGSIAVAGFLSGSTDLNPGFGASMFNTVGNTDPWVAVLSASGTFQWGSAFGSPLQDNGNEVAFDTNGDVLIAGNFQGIMDADPGSFTMNVFASGSYDGYVSKFNTTGDFQWIRTMGGPGDDFAGVITNATNGIIMYGSFSGTVDRDGQSGGDSMTSFGGSDFYILPLTSAGSNKSWLAQMGGTADDLPQNMTIDTEGNYLSTGLMYGNGDYDPASSSEFLLTRLGSVSAFVQKLGSVSTLFQASTQPTDAAPCLGATATFTVAATGANNITYQWQKFQAATSTYTDITDGGGYSGTATGTLSVNTTGNFGAGSYRATVSGDGVTDIISNSAGLTINPLPAAPGVTGASNCGPGSVALTASGTSNGNYRWYTAPTGGAQINGALNSVYNTPSITTTTTYYVSISNGTCESARVAVVATIQTCGGGTNQPPVVTNNNGATKAKESATVDLTISDPDNNLDLASLKIVVAPKSGAEASFQGNKLIVNYANVSFIGEDVLTIEICDTDGSCVQKVITIIVEGNLKVYNAVSPNGDGKNDIFLLEFIDIMESTKENKVTIYNRWGDLVFEIENYNNTTSVFRGVSNSGKDLPSGTYYYKIVFGGGRDSETGYLSLKR